ncbi:MAG: hypothetical protein HBSAPP04_05550 [Ignavibacteriaceae bacterium]|nr:MAG: DUF1207 domain-containing protein [Chlorobiota bacterium]GJQ31716.1 MAG: hypothetical protein HBSAPP04_05550 [Ignavibacteriaceae bacterium]
MRYFRLFLLSIIVTGAVYGQSSAVFPGELNIQPFTSNFLEPRMGVFFQTGQNDLRLDIGASKDIFHRRYGQGATLSLGADFFTYTRLRGESDFHFPVDAVDYLFGVNVGFKKEMAGGREWGTRIRLSHISAHFVDGHYDGPNQRWRDGRNPIVYSREFVELMYYYRVTGIRVYAGASYLFHVDPTEIEPWILQAGFDAFPKTLSFGHFHPFVAYDYKLASTTAYTPSHRVQFGVKFGHPEGAGARLVFTLYQGKNIHGEYYELDDRYFSTGVTIDF